MQQETVIVLDFGGQYNQLIARRVRECNVYCEIILTVLTWQKSRPKIRRALSLPVVPTALICRIPHHRSGNIYSWGVPVLGICYGSQLMMHMLGGNVCKAPEREYGKTVVDFDTYSPLLTACRKMCAG